MGIYDTSETLYHLTHSGWKISRDVTAGLVQQDEPAPSDRVETWERRMKQSSGWSREVVTWRCVWFDPNVPRAKRDLLRKRYPIPEPDSRADIGEAQ